MIFEKLYRQLERLSTRSGILLLFLLAHVVLLLMMLWTFPRINEKLGTAAFDLQTFGYTEDTARSMLEKLDAQTIDFYLFPQLFLLDILYPFLLALFLSVVIIRLSGLINLKPGTIWSNLYVLPFVAMFIDYIENIMIAIMITSSDNLSAELIQFASFCTQLKGVITSISWIAISVLLVKWYLMRRRMNR